MTRGELIGTHREEKGTSGGADEVFWMYRGDYVTEEHKYKKDALEHTTDKGERGFKERFKSGSFTPIWQFARERHIKADAEEELVDVIQERYKDYRVVVDDEDCVGIEIFDQKEGAYRFETGSEGFTEYQNTGKT